MGQKNLKGSVSITNDNDRIRLRWRYQQKRYSFNFSSYTKNNLLEAKKVAITIESDMQENCFDPSLSKYKASAFKKPVGISTENQVAVQQNNLIQKLNGASISGQPQNSPHGLIQHFEFWVKNYRNMDCEKDVDYYGARNMMKRWGQFDLNSVLFHLNKEKFGARTYNKRLTLLKSFFVWAERNKIVIANPLSDVIRKKVKRTEKASRKPFTHEEVKRILEAFKTDSCCPKCSGYKHSHYYPFMFFIFKTGVRNAEAVGIRVKHINFSKKLIHINEVLARTIKGTNAEARIRKETKNGKERVLPLTEDLLQIVTPLVQGKHDDDLVFTSFNGKAIDDRMFQRRIFGQVLKELKIAHRNLYACRHTFGTRCIEEGLTPVMTAFLMGNNPETALRNYVHFTELPKQLPPVE